MNKHIQIREIPEETHRALKLRATSLGLSMSDYLKRLIDRDLKRPDWKSIETRVGQMTPLDLPVSVTDIVREERDSR